MILKIKNVYDEIKQEIKNIKANNYNKIVAKFINIDEKVRNIK